MNSSSFQCKKAANGKKYQRNDIQNECCTTQKYKIYKCNSCKNTNDDHHFTNQHPAPTITAYREKYAQNK